MSEGVSYEDYLRDHGSLTYASVGTSMLPLLREGRDLFTVEAARGRCRVGDVVLYRRPPSHWVLHRVVRVLPDGYVTLGDNSVRRERVAEADVVGVMVGFVRDGRAGCGVAYAFEVRWGEAVALGDPGAADDGGRLWEALRVSRADGFVRGLEGGLDAPLGERGSGLSEGQAQRLAVARAVFSGAPVLLLDEATSALDSATEEQMLRSLRALPGRTIVVAAHRPSAIAACDRAIVLEGGGHGRQRD